MIKPAEEVCEIEYRGRTYVVTHDADCPYTPTRICNEDGEKIFSLPWLPDEDHMAAIIELYHVAMDRGKAIGRDDLRRDLRRLLMVPAAQNSLEPIVGQRE